MFALINNWWLFYGALATLLIKSNFINSWLLNGIILVIPLIYWYLTRQFDYWTNNGVPGPKPWPIFGNALQQVLTPLPYLELDLFRKYGKIYGLFIGSKPVLTVADPELIKQILVKDFHIFIDKNLRNENHPIFTKNLVNINGNDWRRIRSTVSPTFTSGKMKKMYSMVRQCLTEFIEHLDGLAETKKDINPKTLFANLTIDVIATCAFGTKTNTHKDPNNSFSLNAGKLWKRKTLTMILTLICPTFLLKLLNITTSFNESALNFFVDITGRIIENRKLSNSNSDYNDFIQLLLNAEKSSDYSRDDSDGQQSHHLNEGEEEIAAEKKALNIGSTNKFISEDEIPAQAFVFFVAGHETTATALTFCSYELALNPQIQEKLFEEVITSVDANGEIDYDLLAKLEFLDAVISETLRLHSVVTRIGRIASEDYILGKTGITLKKGQAVDIPLTAIHLSEEFYPNADQFIPERFLPSNRHKLIPYTYLPFSVGPRNCVGMRFALMEAKLALVHVLCKFRFVRTARTDTTIQLNRLVRSKSPKNIVIGIEKRV